MEAAIGKQSQTSAEDSKAHRKQVASQWRLIWWKFTRHKVAVVAGAIVLAIYFVGLFAEFLAPSDPNATAARYTYAPPQMLHLFQQDSEGGWRFAPHVYSYKMELDRRSLRRTFSSDPTRPIAVGLFVKGSPYQMWGLIPLERRLIGPLNPGDPFYLAGADRLGRDMLSRVIYGARVSMSIGLVGVTLSLMIGVVLGGVSGYFGGGIDNFIQRLIEFLRSMPTIPLWMGLAAAIPLTWPPLQVYFLITILISLIGWTSLAREVRGRVMSLRDDDFVVAARLDNVSRFRIITRHLVPAFASHIIAVTTLAVPEMILAETALSFLGIGLQPPVVSWGVLLKEAQNINSVATAPWLLFPGLAVVIAVLSLNFLGDGLRDAADPYSRH
jgi:peptide/nickel transport system permease protein